MTKAKSIKNKDKKKKSHLKKQPDKSSRKDKKQLKDLNVNHQQAAASKNKSLKSLKKIQKQLDDIVLQRENEKKFLNTLKKNTQNLGQQLDNTESQLSQQVSKKDLQSIKLNLEKQSAQWRKGKEKLAEEINLFLDLTHRIESKIASLEKNIGSNDSQWQDFNANQEKLFDKISNFEKELNQFTDATINPKYALQDFSEQLNLLSKSTLTITAASQKHDIQFQQLQQTTDELKQKLEQQITQQSKNKKQKGKGKTSLNEENQQHSTTQLTSNLKLLEHKLEKKIASLQQQYNEQSQLISNYSDNNSQSVSDLDQQLNKESNRFNDCFDDVNKQLQKNQKDIKQQIQVFNASLHDSKQNNNQQFDQFNSILDKISQQLSDVTKQSNTLQQLVNSIQNTQVQNNNQNNEQKSNQKNAQHNAQYNKLSQQFISQQIELEDKDDKLHANIQALAKKFHTHNNSQKQYLNTIESQQQTQTDIINTIESQQQTQTDIINKLSSRVTKHRELFVIGLLTTLAISTLLAFNQDIFTQPKDLEKQINKLQSETKRLEILQSEKIQYAMQQQEESLTRFKENIDTHNIIQIEHLHEQSSQMLQQQMADIKEEVVLMERDFKENTEHNEFLTSQIDWQIQQQELQNTLYTTQEEQSLLKQAFNELSSSVNSMILQWQSENTNTQHNAIAINRDNNIIDIDTFTRPFYTIQLIGALNKSSIMYFKKQHNLLSNSQIIKTKLGNKPWYIIVQGHYSSVLQAKKDIKLLPEILQKNNPWIKKIP